MSEPHWGPGFIEACFGSNHKESDTMSNEEIKLPQPVSHVEAWVTRDYGRKTASETLEANDEYFTAEQVRAAILADRPVADAGEAVADEPTMEMRRAGTAELERISARPDALLHDLAYYVYKAMRRAAPSARMLPVKPWKDRLYLDSAHWGDEGYAMQSEIEDWRALAATSAPTEAPSVRKQALEEAARICDEENRDYPSPGPCRCADAIRALAGKPEVPSTAVITDAQITAGAAIRCDCPEPKPIGRNAAIDVFHAMVEAQPEAPKPCRQQLIACGVQAIPKSCPRCGLSPVCALVGK